VGTIFENIETALCKITGEIAFLDEFKECPNFLPLSLIAPHLAPDRGQRTYAKWRIDTK